MFNIQSIKPHTRVQLHALKTHTASNLNRDDMGRPKEMRFGGVTRLRHSSQSIKRAIRKGEVFTSFRDYAHAANGCAPMVRSTLIKDLIVEELTRLGMAADKAAQGAKAVADSLKSAAKAAEAEKAPAKPKAKAKAGADAESEVDAGSDDAGDAAEKNSTQLVAFSQAEIKYIAQHLFESDTTSKTWAKDAVAKLKDLKKSRAARQLRGDLSPEVQLFGRMVTSDLFSGVDASLQVAHAFTVHEVEVERDYWTGVCDTTIDQGKTGSGMIDVRRFGAGVFYYYACIDVDLLVDNLTQSHAELSQDKVWELARDVINAFALAFVGQNPTGYQNSFASHAMPQHVLMEVGGVFPHSAAAAFEKPISEEEGQQHGGTEEAAVVRMDQWLKARKAMYGESCLGSLIAVSPREGDKVLEKSVDAMAALVMASKRAA